MKSAWVRWGIALGLASSTILGTIGGVARQAIALTQEQIVEKLRVVPMFAVANNEGVPIVTAARADNGERANFIRLFVSPADAEQFLQRLQSDDPDLGSNIRVAPWSLAQVYAMSQDPPEDLSVQLVPDREEVEAARALLRQNDRPQETLQGIPLFLVTAGEGDRRSYVTIQQDNETSIPFFFDKAQAETAAQRFAEQQADLADTVRIEVVDLGEAISTLARRNDEWLTDVTMIPSLEAQAFVRELLQRQQSAPQPGAPTP